MTVNDPAQTPTSEPNGARALPVDQDLTATPPPADWVRWAVLILSIISAGALWLAWQTQTRLQGLEQELVRRQQTSQLQASEARLLSRQAAEQTKEAASKVTSIESRLIEISQQRGQVDELIRKLSSSRDETLVADLEASLRVATQQASLTGSAEPLIVALQSADDRLSQAAQPRLDNVRRAVAKDLDRVKATRVADLTTLTIRLDEATRLVDELTLLNSPESGQAARQTSSQKTKPAPQPANQAASAANESGDGENNWSDRLPTWLSQLGTSIWQETRNLVRITRIDQPEAMLISPEQSYFLRENIKLRLLNARLALLSRQTAIAASDLKDIEATLPRYFDVQSRKTQLLLNMVREVATQSTQTVVPRPDDTLAALATVTAGQ